MLLAPLCDVPRRPPQIVLHTHATPLKHLETAVQLTYSAYFVFKSTVLHKLLEPLHCFQLSLTEWGQ